MKVSELIECLKGYEDNDIILGVDCNITDIDDCNIVVKQTGKTVYITDNSPYEHLNNSILLNFDEE